MIGLGMYFCPFRIPSSLWLSGKRKLRLRLFGLKQNWNSLASKALLPGRQNENKENMHRIPCASIRRQLAQHTTSAMTICNFQSINASNPLATIKDIHSYCEFQDYASNTIRTRIRLKRNFNYFTVHNESLHVNAKDWNALFQLEFHGPCLNSHDFTHIGLDVMSPHMESTLQVNIGFQNVMQVLNGKKETCGGGHGEVKTEVQYGSVLIIPKTMDFQTMKVPIALMEKTNIIGHKSNKTGDDGKVNNRDEHRMITQLSFQPKVDTDILIRNIQLMRKVKCSSSQN